MSRGRELLDHAVVPCDQLRRVEAVVGLAKELERADPVFRRSGPPEADRQPVGSEIAAEPRAELRRLGDVRVGEDCELVAADPRQFVARAERARECVGQAAKLDISGRVAVRVVDQLEVVQVG